MTSWDTTRTDRCTLTVPPQGGAARALSLRLRSNRRTHLRVRVDLTAPGVTASAQFVVEWEGEHTLWLTREHFGLAPGAVWPAAAEAVLGAMDWGLPGTVLELEPPVWADTVPPVAVNEDERILEWFQYPPFWDEASWTRCDDGKGADPDEGLKSRWFYATLTYVERAGRHGVVEARKVFDTSLDGVQALRVFAAIDPRCTLSLAAVIDGRVVTLLDAVAGVGVGVELLAPVRGARLESLRFRVEAVPGAEGHSAGQTIGAQLRWIMLERTGAKPDAGRELTGIPPVGGVSLPARPAPPTLPLGLYFGPSDLPRLKERFARGVPKRLFDEIRERARTTWDDEPEPWVGTYLPVDWGSQGVERAISPVERAGIWLNNMLYGGFVFALTHDPRHAQAARKALLATARTGQWAAGFPTRRPVGQPGYRAPFIESHTTEAVALCYDWIHDVLTPEERAEVLRAIFEKGVLWLDTYLRREGEGYLLKSNQGAVYFYGLVIGCLATRGAIPEAGALLERHIPWFRRMLRSYYHSDGSTDEGLGYWEYTTCYATAALELLHRHRGLEPVEMAPPEFPRTVDYLLAMRLPVMDRLAFLNVADNQSRPVKHAGSSLLFFARHYGSDAALWLWKSFLGGAHPPEDGYFVSSALQYGSVAILTALWHVERVCPDPVLPAVSRFRSESSDRLLFQAGAAGEGWLVHFEGGPQTFMHTHMDKGSFLLHAYGEALVTEGGMVSYSDPAHTDLGRTFYHNVLTVQDRDQDYRDAGRAALVTEVRDGEGWSGLTADLTASYKVLTRYIRRLVFLRGGYLVVLDDVQSRERGLCWRLHSAGVFEAPDGAAQGSGQATRIVARTPAAGVEVLLAANTALTTAAGTVRTSAGPICHSLSARPPAETTELRIVGVMVPWKGASAPAGRLRGRATPSGVEISVEGGWGTDVLTCALDGTGGEAPMALTRNGTRLF